MHSGMHRNYRRERFILLIVKSIPKPVSKLCVLGCSGFIGSHLVEKLLSSGEYQISGIDLESEKIKDFIGHPQFHFYKNEISDTDILDGLIRDADAVISLAAICNPSLYLSEPLQVIESSFSTPLQVVKLCAAYQKWLIHFSTCEVYGKTASHVGENHGMSDVPMQENTTHMILGPISKQRWTYSCAKQLFERVIYGYGKRDHLTYTIIRPFNFIGPKMDYIPNIDGQGIPRVVACFMEALFTNTPLKLVDGGKNRRVFTYIDDAIDAIYRIIQRPEKSQGVILNIGNPENELTIRELAEKMIYNYRRLTGESDHSDFQIIDVSGEEFYGEGYDDCDRRLPDITLAKTLLDWYPKVTIDQALLRTISGFIQYYRR
jgi:UDP-apiose/xylose synthase